MASKIVISTATAKKLLELISSVEWKAPEAFDIYKEIEGTISRSPESDEALAAELLIDTINKFGVRSNAFSDVILRSHRTLQQSFMRLMMNTINSLAQQQNYDDRNEATVLLAREIVPIAEEHPLPFI